MSVQHWFELLPHAADVQELHEKGEGKANATKILLRKRIEEELYAISPETENEATLRAILLAMFLEKII